MNIILDKKCTVCGIEMTDDEWHDRHWPHLVGCDGNFCQCDNEVHAECCWECK